ncbi:reverse transcriptase domain-containing protein [Tanacetum coccineum]
MRLESPSHSTTPSAHLTTLPSSQQPPLTQKSPTHTPPRSFYYCDTARMAMRTQPTLSLGLLDILNKVMALSPSSFHKGYRSSYETPLSSSSSSSSTIPSQKRYHSTFELIADTETESDESEEEGTDSESKEATSEDQQEAVPTKDIVEDEPSGLGYKAARRRALELAECIMPSTYEENTPYPGPQGARKTERMKNEHLYSASANEIDEKKPELNDSPAHLEYAYLQGNKSFPIIISSKLSEKEKLSLLQDAKPRLIRWVLLLQGFNIKIKDKKGAENLAADHLSRLKNLGVGELAKKEIVDEFLNEHLMILKTKLNDYEHGMQIMSIILLEMWLCPNNIMRRCIGGNEFLEILAHCHSSPTRDIIVPRLLEERSGNISSRSEMPQNNILTKDTNRAIKRILERSVGYNPKGWSEKLNDALWAFRTTYKTPTGCTPFQLVYGKACHLPVEIKHKAYWALKQCNIYLTAAAKNRFMELNELMELKDGAYEITRIYKERTKKWHESRLHGDKYFKVGDKVLLFNSRLRLHLGKLKSKWYGPYVVKNVYPYRAVEITNKNGSSFKVNGQRLKKYYDRSIDTKDDEVIKFDGNEERA